MPANAPIFSFDWAPDAIIVTRPDGSVLHINPRAEDLFGYRKDELSDKPLELLIPEGLASSPPRSSSLQHLSRTVTCAHRDGRRFPGRARWRPAPDGHGDYVVFAIRDIDGEERPVEAGAESIEPRIELLSLFAHDVRESLQAIQYLCDNLQSRAPMEATAITEVVGSICALLERLTRVSQTYALDPAVESCGLDEMLVALARELTPLATRKGLRLSVDGDALVVMTDPVLLRELLHNLIANAIRYTDTGCVDVRWRAGTDHVRVEIVDTGVGIAPARLRALLNGLGDPESSPDRHRTYTTGGGLGLSIVQRLARLLGCTLEVDSTPGRGSCFAVLVPRHIDVEAER